MKTGPCALVLAALSTSVAGAVKSRNAAKPGKDL